MSQPIELPTVNTERLLLRAFSVNDGEAVRQLAGDRRIADTTLNVPHPYEPGMAEQWIATHESLRATGELAVFALALRESLTLIGAMSLQINSRCSHANLGYWIGHEYWNKGYCTEAAEAVLTYGFTDLGLNRIHASHLARNPASGKVMQKIGMQHEGVQREHTRKWDRYEDLVIYGLLKRERQSRQEG